ncbi:hypothetical protein ACPPVO_53040 [Dactylosporangium sp. McL0621]|uniref:hypothetical protein n=1 Tax=Dactylosporangium sp. McL0621 TaxID=3415678 RepID=UPI003CF64EC7
MNDRQLRRLMHGGDEAPASRVDLARVVADGRRRRFRRTATAGAATALALTVVTTLALNAPRAPVPPAPASTPVPAASPPETSPATGREPP